MKIALLDIEGTISPFAFVHNVMIPMARERIRDFVTANRSAAEFAADFDALQLPSEDAIAAYLTDLSDRDVKDTLLKKIQGRIWKDLFEAGRLRSELYPDVLPQIHRWHQQGVATAIYSSGSAEAQQLFFRYNTEGDITPLFSHHFDTTIGGKKEAGSYTRIATILDIHPQQITFYSDIAEELQAARAAGMEVVLVVREGHEPASTPFRFIRSFG